MERFSQRESLLLGYSPQCAFVNSGSSHTPTKNSDVDFHDVFGGPLRRSSTNEMRYSFSETTESSGLKRDAYDDGDDDWSGLIEKPVFGEGSVNRRRTQSDDFFDDIFKGNHSVSSSPRRLQRDPFASAPGSQVLSPAHPLLHKPEPSAASSLPAQFSLPDGFSKGVVDLPAFGSAARTSSLSRYSNQAIDEESRNDIRSSTRQSSSSRDFSLVGEGSSSLATSDKADTGVNSEQDSKSSENPTSSSPFQFHFSIYRWASKGVPIVIPLRGRNGSRVQERTKNEEDSSTKESAATESTRRESPKSTLPNTDFPSNEDPLADARSPTLERNIQENDLLLDEITPDKVDPQQFVEKAILPVTKSGTVSSLRDITGDVSGNTISFHKSEDIEPRPLLKTASSEDRQKEIPALMERVHEPVLNPVRSLFFDEDLQQGNDEVTKTSSKKEIMVKGTKKSSADADTKKTAKHQDRKRSSSTKIEVIKASFQGSPKNSGDNLGRTKVKGKVKDFVKMFNQEVLCKPTYDGRNLGSHSSRTMEKGAPKAENEASITATRMNNYLQKSDVKNTFSDASVKMKEDLKQLEKEYSESKTASFMLNNAPVQDIPASSTGSVPDGSKPIIEDADESFPETFQTRAMLTDERSNSRSEKRTAPTTRQQS
ncbi:J domain-containing protein required for chloroplast accumulation response 1-like [Pyrus ussuriensis x Pyrus communis]|uniref:J domain-containing protein required for chloroplast accumulation response 1-like n=1 Tax=Pyrus ussuriensis x Pyrus communis TaxID=2448454 RepID=A0A5N5FLZ9_9ROSA|nr:J domain-containing protein required for chloroplast accumulation response 1-like [Pyrus ussuriensis x Pyrus communis]